MTKTITITDLSEVRAGDLCTVEIEGRQYTGPAYSGVGNVLKWGGHTLRYNGVPRPYVTFVSAARESPSLPTELGSAILIHEALGKVCDKARRFAREAVPVTLVPTEAWETWETAKAQRLDELEEVDVMLIDVVDSLAQGVAR